MRVLFWSELFWPYGGGAQFVGLNLMHGLRDRGHEFIVVTRQDDPELPDEDNYQGFPIYRFPFFSALAERDLTQLISIRKGIAKLKRQFAPDLVHINCFGLSILFHLDTVKAHSAPLLLTLQSEKYPPPGEHDTVLERALRSAAWITAPSAKTVEYARQLLPGVELPASHIHNGLAAPSIEPAKLPVDMPLLLCLGRLVPNKGFDLALQALAKVIQQFPQARMVIAGDGPARAELEQMAADLDLRDAVDFVGWVDAEQVPDLINTATVVVVPSREWESFPLVALESAFMARPVVAARDAGLPEAVLHEETGLLVDKDDIAGLAEALASLIGNPTKAIDYGQAARERALDLFSLKRFIDSYEALYRKFEEQKLAVVE